MMDHCRRASVRLAIVGAVLLAVAAPRASSLEVRDLTTATFDKVVDGSTNVLIEFHKPDCGHCRTFEPEYYEVADILEEEDGVILARVDTDAHPALGKRFDIDGHPIFKWFKKGDTEPEKFYFVHYTGRMGNTLLRMLGERIKGLSKTLPPITSEVVKVKAEEFPDKVLDKSKNVVAVLFSPWQEPKPVADALEKVAKIYGTHDDFAVVKMPIERVFERDIADQYECKNYPCFFWFPKDNEWERLPGPHDSPDSFVKFINKKLGTSYSAAKKAKVELGRIKMLDDAVVKTKGKVTEALVAELKASLTTLPEDQHDYAKHYIKVAESVIAKGDSYVDSEAERLTGMLTKASLSPAKKSLFKARKNILGAFKAAGVGTEQEL